MKVELRQEIVSKEKRKLICTRDCGEGYIKEEDSDALDLSKNIDEIFKQ